MTRTLFVCLAAAAALPGREWPVPSGGGLQYALNEARPGDEIVLEPGGSYHGNFILLPREGDGIITVRTAATLPEGRLTAESAAALPKLISPNRDPVLATWPRARGWRFVGIDFGPGAGLDLNELIRIGDARQTADETPSQFEFDRVWVHGDAARGGKRGIALNGSHVTIRDSRFTDFKRVGQDTQAICGWNGPGPFVIWNNLIEAAGENVMFGGAEPSIAQLVPADILVAWNTFRKPLRWKRDHPEFEGVRWSVKNLFEIKNGRRVSVENNLFEHNWEDAQAGFALLIKGFPEDSGAWAVAEDIAITGNVIRRSGSGINIAFESTRNIAIRDNVFEEFGGQWGGQARLLQVLYGAGSITFEHNTASGYDTLLSLDGDPMPSLVFRMNVLPVGRGGVKGSGAAAGVASLAAFFREYDFSNNVLIGGAAPPYPANNWFSGPDAVFRNAPGGDYRLPEDGEFGPVRPGAFEPTLLRAMFR